MKRIIPFVFLLGMAVTAGAQQLLPYQNPALSDHERAVDLLGRLTLPEKALLMIDESEPVDRLGIDRFFWWSEDLHGVANQDNVTNFPEPVGMAASFNHDLVFKVFDVTSIETRAKYNGRNAAGLPKARFKGLSVWTPNVNLFRDPRWGRGQESYGEDPYLLSKMGTAVVEGLQGPREARYRRLLACAKHYAIHSGPEYTRHHANLTDIAPRDLWESYMPAFKALVQDADVREVMCAYQRWDDQPCCGSNRLLQRILRDEWGFKYLVVSDCGAVSDFWRSHKSSSNATHAAAAGVLAGTDVECGSDYKNIPAAVKAGLIDEKDLDKSLIRLLEGRFSLGEMETDPSLCEWNAISPDTVECASHNDLTYRMAQQTMVLLQNNNSVLPIKKSRKVAVIGPNAHNERMMWGNYNGVPTNTVSILEGIQSKIGGAKVFYLPGCDHVDTLKLESYYSTCAYNGATGTKASYWTNPKMEGEPTATRHFSAPFSQNTLGRHPFGDGIPLEGFSAKYETAFTAKATEDLTFHIEGSSGITLKVNGETIYRTYTWRYVNENIIFKAEAGKKYNVELLYTQVPTWNAAIVFDFGVQSKIDYAKEIEALKGYDYVVFCGGISPQLEGEEMPIKLPGFRGGDRTSIELPAVQREYLKALKAAGKKVVFVNCSGSAVALEPETKSCDAILQAWYAGERGGDAVADVIFGDYNPGGKLPVTFYRNDAQLPDYEDYSMKGRTYRYMTEDPLFAFGYGLSYSNFEIGKAKLSATEVKAGETVSVIVPVTNKSKKAGDEVVQVYIRREGDAEGPSKTLRGYARVNIPAKGKVETEIKLDGRSFEWWDEQSQRMQTLPGTYTVFYGNSSRDADLQSVTVTLK
ncbi:MAG: glycoside hydrolase family 3 C-terminal domain-containing protein [Bacteroidales bacterium]|nr:glycoside hydrolase family 3 C-terminal domain-containing protein [Bacteroidales bacterium]